MRKKRRARRGATTHATDEELIANLAELAPELLESKVSEAEFGDVVEEILKKPPTVEIRHFYCRRCREYHLKTHAHYQAKKKSSRA
jgi:hypothetical protein